MVRAGGSLDATLDVRGLALLYAGRQRAAEIARLELLRGASAGTLAALDVVFGGPSPWMAEIV